MKQGWEIKKLGDCFESIRNGATIKQERGATGIPITRIETLSGGLFNRDRLGYANIHSTEKYTSYVLDDGDLLLSHINSKAYIGRSVVYNKLDNEEIIHGMNLLRLKAIRTILSPYYAYYCFKSELFRNQVASYRKDAVNQSSIPVSDLKKISIPIPPLPEQEKIVSELDCLSGLIEKKRQQLKELDALAQSIFYEMFGNPVENERGWEVKKLGEICSLKAGKSIKANELSPNLTDGLYPCFGGNGIRGYIAKVSHKESFPIIGRQGALCGNVVLSTKEFYATEHAVVVQPLIRMNTIWLFYTLKFMNLNRLAQGVAQPGLSVNRIIQESIPLPPFPLQQTFDQKVEAIEKQKELIKQSITEAETLLASRMQYYFE